MKRRISKRIIAIGMSLCVAFSIMPLPVSAEAETAAPAVKQNNLWVSTGKTFVNRIYTVGLTTCGSALVRIAGATESEGFQKVASFVNKWICGGNNTGQTLAEIQALCNEILNEVKIVDQHLKEYDAEIENTLQKIQYTEAKNELNQQWSKDIDVYETAGNVGNTLSAYEDYMKAAQLYMDGKTDINAVEKSKQKLYDNFIEVYKAAGNSFENPTDEKKKDAIFCNDTIDGVFKRSIWSMINALNKPSDEKNYADAAAQFAYRAYGFSGDQYNYIVSSIDKQFMEIIKMEMMYQEFIAQRGDYFEEKYPDDESKWESYAAWATSYTIFHVVDTTGQYPGSSLESSTLSAEKIQPDKSAGAYSAYTVILKNRPQEDGYYKTKVDVATNGVGDTELEMVQEDGTTCQENIVPSGKEVTLRFKAEGTTVLESITLQRHNNTENPSEVTSEETLLTKDQIATLSPDEEGYYTYTYSAPYSNATFVLNGAVGHKVYVKGTNQSFEDAIQLDSYVDYFEEGENVEFYVSDNVKSVGYYEGNTYKELALTENYEGDRKGSFVMPAKDITLYYNAVCKEHSYDNGFCTKCGGYQPADYNESTGSYEIGNGGQMFWFAALVNGDGEHTQIQEAKPDAHGVLVSDISLKNPADENYEWKPIGEFKGIFDGQNHTISDFSMTKVNDQSIGFFQNLMSDPNETDEAKKATLKNFTLNGTIATTAEAASAVGGVVGTTSGGVIRRVNSNVNIASGVIYDIGGIVGAINAATSIEESTYSGKIVLDYNFYGVGGIVGFVTDDDTYAGGTKIKDCANYGLITYYKVKNYGGRGYSGGITGQVALGEEDFILSDCYNYGSVLAEEWKEIYGAISGYCAAKKDGIKNNYYLDTLPVKGFLGEAELANDEELAKAKTAEQFKSGEEAYLLNKEVTDGSQVWYQNIDNGEIPDAYPVLDDTHGTVYRWEDGTYSNYEKEPVEETYEIRTFEEFKKIPEIVKKNNRANFKLMNTIFGNGETMTESIGSADNPYNGTFDGQGYYVYRFDIKSSDGNAALFDTIGARGSVKNFAAFYQNIEGEKAAGLAIVNYGLIDECISGSNLSGPFTDQLTKEPKNLTETTTFVKGTSMAGGVVVENKGVIRNTANYAKATASASDGIVGGIAVVNSGTIENCMSIGTLSTKENGIAGGIVGKLDKNGSIQIAYSAQTAIEGGTTGAVFGAKEETAGAVNNTYYQDTLSGNEEQGTAKTAAEMKSNAFKEELNTLVAGNEELCSWTWNSTKNQGYPRILSSLITEVELVNASKGVTVKGMMHKDTKLQLNELDKKNDIYQAFKKYAQKADKQVLYSAELTLVYGDGQPAPYEGNLNVKLDLSKYRGKGYKVLVYRNNQIEELEIDKQMIASKDVEEMVPFAVLAEKSEISKAVDHIKDTVKTGDNSSVILLLCIVVVAGSVAGGVIYWRKKKAKK